MTTTDIAEQRYRDAVAELDAAAYRLFLAKFDLRLTAAEAFRIENAALAELLSEPHGWDGAKYASYGVGRSEA